MCGKKFSCFKYVRRQKNYMQFNVWLCVHFLLITRIYKEYSLWQDMILPSTSNLLVASPTTEMRDLIQVRITAQDTIT